MLARFLVAVAAMVAVVAASNFLVQYPVQAQIGGINLADLLTWGAFTYPVAFLVTDLTNRHFGANGARLVVVCGFAVAVVLSVWLATPRIAIASGTAFLVAQFLDISIFDRLRRKALVAGAAVLVARQLGARHGHLLLARLRAGVRRARYDVRPRGRLARRSARRCSGSVARSRSGSRWPRGDFLVKLLLAALCLAPYGALRRWLEDRVLHPARV